MYVLDTTTKSLQILLASSGTLPFSVSWNDVTTTTFVPGSADGYTAGTVPATLVASPGASTERVVKSVSVLNTGASSATVKVRLNDNGALYDMVNVTLTAGQSLHYTDADGWKTIGTDGTSRTDGYAAASTPTRGTWRPAAAEFISTETFILTMNDQGVHNRTTTYSTDGGSSVSPIARYTACGYPCVRTATTWHPDDDAYGGRLDVVGSGTAPTPWKHSPLWGPWDGSMQYVGGQYHACVDTTTGDLDTTDLHIETLFKAPDTAPVNWSNRQVIAAKRNAGVGWEIGIQNDLKFYALISDSDGYAVAFSAALSAGSWNFADFHVDRDEASASGSEICINGKTSGTGVNMSATELTLSNGVAMTIGADGGGNFKLSGEVAYIAIHKNCGFAGDSTGHTAMIAKSAERFLRACDLWPKYAAGTYVPSTWTRDGTYWLQRLSNDKKRKLLFKVGAHWPPIKQTWDQNGNPFAGFSDTKGGQNVVLYSQDFTNAAWTKSGCSAASGYSAPDGSTTACLITEGTSAAAYVSQGSLAYSNTYCCTGSIFVKAAFRSVIKLTVTVNAAGSAYYNLVTGEVTSQTSGTAAHMDYWGDGWWRCSLSVAATATNTNGSLRVDIAQYQGDIAYTGLSVESVYLWQAQQAQNSEFVNPGSILPTTSASVSGTPSALYYKGDDGNQGSSAVTEGRCQTDVVIMPPRGDYIYNSTALTSLCLWASSDGGYTNDVYLTAYRNNTLYATFYYRMAASVVYPENVNTADGLKHTILADFKTNNRRITVDGGQYANDTTSATAPAVSSRTRLYIGRDAAGVQYNNDGCVQAVLRFWPTSAI